MKVDPLGRQVGPGMMIRASYTSLDLKSDCDCFYWFFRHKFPLPLTNFGFCDDDESGMNDEGGKNPHVKVCVVFFPLIRLRKRMWVRQKETNDKRSTHLLIEGPLGGVWIRLDWPLLRIACFFSFFLFVWVCCVTGFLLLIAFLLHWFDGLLFLLAPLHAVERGDLLRQIKASVAVSC